MQQFSIPVVVLYRYTVIWYGFYKSVLFLYKLYVLKLIKKCFKGFVITDEKSIGNVSKKLN
jgi:hypothetical protein